MARGCSPQRRVGLHYGAPRSPSAARAAAEHAIAHSLASLGRRLASGVGQSGPPRRPRRWRLCAWVSALVVSRAWCSRATRARRSAHGIGPLSSVAVHVAVGLTQLSTAMLLWWAPPCHGSIASRAMEGGAPHQTMPSVHGDAASGAAALVAPTQAIGRPTSLGPVEHRGVNPVARRSVTAGRRRKKTSSTIISISPSTEGVGVDGEGWQKGRAHEARAGNQLDAADTICVREVRAPHLRRARCVASQAGQAGPLTWLPSAIAERGGAYAGAWVRIRKHFDARRRGAAGAGGCVFGLCVRPRVRHIMLGMWQRWRPAQDPRLHWTYLCGPHRAIRPQAHGWRPVRSVSTQPRLASRLWWPHPRSPARSRPRGDNGGLHALPLPVA